MWEKFGGYQIKERKREIQEGDQKMQGMQGVIHQTWRNAIDTKCSTRIQDGGKQTDLKLQV